MGLALYSTLPCVFIGDCPHLTLHFAKKIDEEQEKHHTQELGPGKMGKRCIGYLLMNFCEYREKLRPLNQPCVFEA
jgi:hypothetical protein